MLCTLIGEAELLDISKGFMTRLNCVCLRSPVSFLGDGEAVTRLKGDSICLLGYQSYFLSMEDTD